MGKILGSPRILGVVFIALVVLAVYLTYATFTKKFSSYDRVTLETSSIGLQLPDRADVKVRGVIVGEVNYHSSQPWPMPASLMVGFTAVARDPAIRLRDRELEDARWFTSRQIADGIADGSFLPSTPLSVSYRLLQHWLRERAGMELDALLAARAEHA